jgi:alpha-galactosidase
MLMAETTTACSPATTTITATRLAQEIVLDARHPSPEWAKATPATFCADWQGRNADPARQTEVRALWTPAHLYLRFVCHYREIFVFEDSDPNGRRDDLWERDVAEAFLQPDPARPQYYKEFEVSPNGQWIDLDIGPRNISREEPPRNSQSGMTRSVWLDEEQRIWSAELAIPMAGLTRNFKPGAVWRANFFRVEGTREPRFYSAWQPTKTAQADFHAPEAFGYLRFV